MRIKKFYYPVLAVLPALLVITAVFLNQARGPFWLGHNLDPDYVYLLNATNMADLKKPGHIDHPGTSVQLLGAITMRVVHFFHFSSPVDLHTDVLYRPEYYLNAIITVMNALDAVILLILGFVTYKSTQNPWLSLWLQLAPFFSNTLLNNGLTRVAPEPLLLFASLLVILMLVRFMHSPSYSYKNVLLFALVMGFGFVTKITFAPLLLIPLVIFPGFKKKLAYITGVLLSFVLFTLPIIGMYNKFFNWIYNLLIHKKSYGAGPKGIIPLNLYIKHLKKLLMSNPFFTLVLLTAILLVVIALIIPRFRHTLTPNIKFKLLVSVLAAQVLGVLIVGKHPARHYLLPALSLSGVTVFFIFYTGKDLFNQFNFNINYLKFACILFIAGSFIIINPIRHVSDLVHNKSRKRDKALAVYQEAERKYPDYAKIYSYGSSSPPSALKFGNDLSRNYHGKILQSLYKNVYFYNFARKKLFTFDYNQTVPLEMIRSKHGDKLLFQGLKWIKIPGLKLQKAFKSGIKESIFLLK